MRLKIQRHRPGRFRRPRLVLAPLVGPRFKHPRFGKLSVSLPLQIILEERKLNRFAIVDCRLRIESDIPQAVAITADPATVQPGPHHNHVRRARAVRLDRPIGLQGSEQILGIEPSADRQHGRLDVLEMGAQVPRFPEIVVGLVPQSLAPERNIIFEKRRIGVGQWSHPQKEVIAVRRFVVERVIELLGRSRAGPAKLRHEVEKMRQDERAIVMPVVPDKPIGNRSLG